MPERAARGSAAVFVAMGVACVIAGGLVAAVTAPAASELGSWSAAYLVLVAGVVQVALGIGQALLAPRLPNALVRSAEFAAFNVANACVIVGTLIAAPPLVDVGGVLLFIALAIFFVAVLGHGDRYGGRYRWVLYCYRIVLVIVAVSTPVGLVLAQLKSS